MRILLVDGDQGIATQMAEDLGDRGHDVVRCFPLEGQDMCVGASDPSSCPVDSLGCDVAVVVHDQGAEHLLREMGAVCATRRHIPVIDALANSAPISEVVESYDTGARPRLVAAVEDRLRSLPAVERMGRLPTVSVRMQDGRLMLTIDLVPGTSRSDEESIVTWAARALRESEPTAATADVVVHGRALVG